jgi:hypothetical protein
MDVDHSLENRRGVGHRWLALALVALALPLLIAAIAALRHLASASAAGAPVHCGAVRMGTEAGETLEGTAGSDLIRARAGRDTVMGQRGGDCLRGGPGNDTVKGGAGADHLRGGRGDDTLRGGAGHDFLRGGPGNDGLVARHGERDVVRCGGGTDLALVGANDKVRGCERVRPSGSGGGHGGGAGYPSFPHPDWDGSFDGCQLIGSAPGAWDINETNADHRGGSTTLERSVVGEGQCAAKFTNGASSDMGRAELGRNSTGADPEFTYEMLVRVPSGQTFPEGSSLTQTKQESSGGGCYNGGLRIGDHTGTTGGQLTLTTVFACTHAQSRGQQEFVLGALPRNRWFALKVYEKFSNNPQVGLVQAWKDADGPGPGGYVEVLRKTHVDNEGNRGHQHVRMRIGSYRQATDHATTIYIDGFHLECEAHC